MYRPSERPDLDRAAVVRVRQADLALGADERPQAGRRVEVLRTERVPREEPTVFLVESSLVKLGSYSNPILANVPNT